MSKPQMYCVASVDKVVFLNSFAEVLDYYEKRVQPYDVIEKNFLLEVYKWNTSGYVFYCLLSN